MALRPLDQEHVLWVGAAGSGAAFATLKAVRRMWGDQVRVVAADTNPPHLVAASQLADAFEQVPPVVDRGFQPALVEGLARHGVDTYVPILDEEIVLAAELVEDGVLAPTVRTTAPGRRAAAICFDKLAAAEWLASEGFPTPATWPVLDAIWRPEGVFVKPRRGRGSIGARHVRSHAELELIQASADEVVAQELCRDPEITVDAFRSPRHELFRAVCRERLEVKAGVCTKARVFADVELAGLAREIAERLDLAGTSCIQFMRAPDDAGWLVTDVNPRPGAGTPISAALGVDFFGATLAEVWGVDPRPLLPELAGEQHVVREYREYVL